MIRKLLKRMTVAFLAGGAFYSFIGFACLQWSFIEIGDISESVPMKFLAISAVCTIAAIIISDLDWIRKNLWFGSPKLFLPKE